MPTPDLRRLVCDEPSCAAFVDVHPFHANRLHLAGVRASIARHHGWGFVRTADRGWRPVCPRCMSS